MPPAFDTLGLQTEAGIAVIGFDHPPLNLFDPVMEVDLERAMDAIEADPSVRVILFESRNPEYFLAHYDVASILAEDTARRRTTSGGFNRLMQRIEASPAVTIGKVAGAARGGGCELLLALDMRFAARERAVFSFPEVALGILAAGGGTQRLPLAIGRGRALEMLLVGDDVDGEVAELYGLVNRALSESQLDDFVGRLCERIASHPPQAVELTKFATRHSRPAPEEQGLAFEALALDLLKAEPGTRVAMRRFLEAGGQTPEGERDFEALLAALRQARRA